MTCGTKGAVVPVKVGAIFVQCCPRCAAIGSIGASVLNALLR